MNIPIAAGVLIAAAYVLTGKLGLMLALPPGYASPIFPPAGLAIAVAYLAGAAALPWIFLGSLLLNLMIAAAPITLASGTDSVWIAAATTAQAFVGGWLLRRLLGHDALLDSGSHIARFLISAPIICLVSSTLSVSGLWLLGTIELHALLTNWSNWWIGDTLGAIVVFPLTMLFFGRPVEKWRRRRLMVAIPTLLAFSLVVIGHVLTSRTEQAKILQGFRVQAQQFADHLQQHLEEQTYLLEQLDAHLSVHDNGIESRAHFGRFARQTLTEFPMIQALEWVPQVTNRQRAAFIQAQSEEIPGFDIRQRNNSGEMVRAGQRDSYFPVTYVEPLLGNQEALGFDLASNPTRRQTVKQAMKSDKPVATPPLHLVQEKGQQYGILLLKRVSAGKNAPGLVLSVLRVGDFVKALD